MSTFSFDCESNFVINKTPSVKAINSDFCGEDKGGLWIADENMAMVKWRKNCGKNCTLDCVDHFVSTQYHGIKTNSRDDNGRKIIISGRGVINPRLIILRESKQLKFEISTRKYAGIWKLGDKEIMEGDKRKYRCERKYLLIFLDEKNYPLHEGYIQFSVKGTFMVKFDNALKEFREKFFKSYCKATNRSIGRIQNSQWNSMCVFIPTFGTQSVKSSYKGPNGESLESDACYVESYIIPTPSNWETMCIGRNMEVNEIVSLRYSESSDWYEKYTMSPTKKDEMNSIVNGYDNKKSKKKYAIPESSEEDDIPVKNLIKKLKETDFRQDSDSE